MAVQLQKGVDDVMRAPLPEVGIVQLDHLPAELPDPAPHPRYAMRVHEPRTIASDGKKQRVEVVLEIVEVVARRQARCQDAYLFGYDPLHGLKRPQPRSHGPSGHMALGYLYRLIYVSLDHLP